MEPVVIRRGQEELLQVTRRQFLRVDQVAGWVEAFLDYSREFNSTLSGMFNTPRVNFGTGPFHFPTPPVFPDYTLYIEDEDDNEGMDDDTEDGV